MDDPVDVLAADIEAEIHQPLGGGDRHRARFRSHQRYGAVGADPAALLDARCPQGDVACSPACPGIRNDLRAFPDRNSGTGVPAEKTDRTAQTGARVDIAGRKQKAAHVEAGRGAKDYPAGAVKPDIAPPHLANEAVDRSVELDRTAWIVRNDAVEDGIGAGAEEGQRVAFGQDVDRSAIGTSIRRSPVDDGFGPGDTDRIA